MTVQLCIISKRIQFNRIWASTRSFMKIMNVNTRPSLYKRMLSSLSSCAETAYKISPQRLIWFWALPLTRCVLTCFCSVSCLTILGLQLLCYFHCCLTSLLGTFYFSWFYYTFLVLLFICAPCFNCGLIFFSFLLVIC